MIINKLKLILLYNLIINLIANYIKNIMYIII